VKEARSFSPFFDHSIVYIHPKSKPVRLIEVIAPFKNEEESTADITTYISTAKKTAPQSYHQAFDFHDTEYSQGLLPSNPSSIGRTTSLSFSERTALLQH
jgi:hypothetical protein